MEEILQKYQRSINSIIEEDRGIRRKGLEDVKSLFKELKDGEKIIEFFQKYIFKSLTRSLDDKVEKHREITLQLIQTYLSFSPQIKNYQNDTINTIIRLLIQRINTQPYNEPSEELRLIIVKIFQHIVQNFYEEFYNQIPDFCNMISKILLDSFQDVKKETALLIITSSKYLRNKVGHHCTQIVKSLSLNVKHQHKLALATILLTEGAGAQLEHALSAIKGLSNDKIADVRMHLYQEIGTILNGFSVANLDKFESSLVAVLLNGLSDESPDVIAVTQNVLEKCGEKRMELAQELGEQFVLND